MTLTGTPWLDYAAHRPQHGVVGHLKLLRAFHSPQLNNQRDVLVWLPESYYSYEHTDRRYPVIYMHDGQNLFDSQTSFAGNDWKVDETMLALGREGMEAIVVGLNHSGETRTLEYNPFANSPLRGSLYLDFIVDTLKPLIDRDLRTWPNRNRTAIVGSSMGGLISLYAFFHRPDIFGLVGALSPSLWVNHFGLLTYVRHARAPAGRLYVDCGTREMDASSLRDLLREKGYAEGNSLHFVREEGGDHTEIAWARRLPAALRFLLR